ncbi:hypothetical protein Aduo_000383 [Ancylostoma duodenale]
MQHLLFSLESYSKSHRYSDEISRCRGSLEAYLSKSNCDVIAALYAGGSIKMLEDNEHQLPSGDWFHVVLIALTITICFNITVLSYRYFAIIRREKLDRMNKSKEMVRETWYLEKEMIKKEAENRRKKREAAKNLL